MANKENLRKWVRALVSGEYKQGHGSLRVGDSFCCLGVACDISGVGAWVTESSSSASYVVADENSPESEVRRSWSALPQAVVKWLGIEEETKSGNPRIDNGDGLHYAATMNDAYRASFREIAEAIVRTYDLDPSLLET